MNDKDRKAMKTRFTWKVLNLALIGAIWLCPVGAWAHLPHPIQASGVLLAIDHETCAVVFKAAKEKKPVVLDWNKETEFIKNGQPVLPTALTNGTSLRILYKNVSFRNPLLKKVIWQEPVRSP